GGSDTTNFGTMLRFLHLLSGGASINKIFDYAIFYQFDPLARLAFPIEWRTRLQRVMYVVVNGDVVAENLRTDPVCQKRALVEDGKSAEIEEHEPDQIKDSGRLENHRVLAGSEFSGCGRIAGFPRGSLRQFDGIQVPNVWGVRLLPTRRVAGQHGDGNFRGCLRVVL